MCDPIMNCAWQKFSKSVGVKCALSGRGEVGVHEQIVKTNHDCGIGLAEFSLEKVFIKLCGDRKTQAS